MRNQNRRRPARPCFQTANRADSFTTVHTGLFTEDGPPTQPCSEHAQTICCGCEGQPCISFTEEDADANTFTPFALVNG